MTSLSGSRRGLTAVSLGTVLMVVAAVPDAGAASQHETSAITELPENLTVLPAGGSWVSYGSVAGPAPLQPGAPFALVRAVERGCPSGTTSYPADKRAYNCLSTYHDNGNNGHSVGLRQGRTGKSAFGYLHALRDHGLDEESIGTVIVNNAAGIAQGNGRHLYGLRYVVNDVGVLAVEVIEDRKPSSASPDNYRLGVITAYCKGYTKCPAGVNASLP